MPVLLREYLVQAVIVADLTDADYHRRTTEAAGLLAGLFPFPGDEPNHWPQCAQLLTHAQAVLAHARTLQVNSPALVSLLIRTGSHLWGRVQDFRLALQLHEQALATCQRLHDSDHFDVAFSLNELAFVLRTLGSHGRARELDQQALAMRQRLADRRSAPGD